MGKTRLDQQLQDKIAAKISRPQQYVREQISKKASRLGITADAAQVLWAKQLGIGTAKVHASLPGHIQQQVMNALPTAFANSHRSISKKGSRKAARTERVKDPIRLAIEYLLSDDELKRRCGDLLRAHGNFDRVLREATTVLDDRLKRTGNITIRMNPTALVGKVIAPDPKKAILVFSDEPAEQEGVHSMFKGVMLAFRDRTHHELTDKITQKDALKFCGFVDTLLGMLKNARVNSAAPVT